MIPFEGSLGRSEVPIVCRAICQRLGCKKAWAAAWRPRPWENSHRGAALRYFDGAVASGADGAGAAFFVSVAVGSGSPRSIFSAYCSCVSWSGSRGT